MKLKTFYRIYYRHRVKKASIILKIYLLIIIPLKYSINFFYLPKKKNLDNFSKDHTYLFNKDLNFLCEFFNSDKGEKFKNQYDKPFKNNKEAVIEILDSYIDGLADLKESIKTENGSKLESLFTESRNRRNEIFESIKKLESK